MYEKGMINTVLNELQIYRTKYTSDLVDEPMISQALMSAPHKVSSSLSYIFGIRNESTLDFLTGGTGRTMYIENREYEWDVMIEAEKPVTINSAKWQGATISSTDTPGINGTPIQVWTSEKFFEVGSIVEFDDKNYQARVNDVYQDGHEWCNTLQVADGQAKSYIPPSLFDAGRQLSEVGSAYEELSDEATILHYQTPFKLRNQLTTMRLKYDITGSAFSTVMVIEMRDPTTKKRTRYWADYQEWLALRKWYRQLDYQLVYDQYTAASDNSNMLKGTNGRPVYRGAGMLQQIAPANRRYYTTLTLDILDDFLSDLSYNVLGFNERNFVALGGEMAMKELDRVLRAKASSYSLIDTHFVSGQGQELTLGGQFTTYKGLNGISLTIKHFPLYDNTYHNRLLHPVSGKPVESYRLTFLDFGMRDGESNIVKVARKGRELVQWYTGGSVSPAGFANSINTLRSDGRDGYTVHFLGEVGIMIKDPTTCGELILDVDGV